MVESRGTRQYHYKKALFEAYSDDISKNKCNLRLKEDRRHCKYGDIDDSTVIVASFFA